MKNLAFRATAVLAVFSIFAIFATGNTNTAKAQTQNSTSSQVGALVDMVCASALNSTATASLSNQTTPYAANATTPTTNSSALIDNSNTTTATTDSDGMLQSAVKAKLLQSVANAKMYVQDACMAIQNDELQNAMGYLVVVEKEIYNIEGNLTSADATGNTTETSASTAEQEQNQTGMNDPFAGLRELFGG